MDKFVYVEPFVGSGAVLFWILSNYNISKGVINDINSDLTNCYRAIQNNVDELIRVLFDLEKRYNAFNDENERKSFYLSIRNSFNLRNADTILHSAYLIFLNRTCFNGLYRVNSKNEFNVPFGKYKNPTICDSKNLNNVSKHLENVVILNGDYTNTLNEIENNRCFFYFDPPYKPISKTSSFNSYAHNEFNDKEQLRLKNFCDELNERNIPWLLSNSDVKNFDPSDEFFDDLYNDYNIERVKAKRAINSNSEKRGEISELLIKNY